MNQQTIKQLETELQQAMLTSDVKKLDELISEELIFTIPTGQVANKQMDLDAHRTGVQKLTKLELVEQTIKCHDSFAVVAAKMLLEGTFGPETISGNFCYTRVWAALNGSLQVVAGHVSMV